MPDKIKISGAVLDHFSRSAKGGTAVFYGTLTQSLCKDMEWGEVPMFQTKATLEGDLAATLIEIVPSDKQMARHALELTVSRVYAFEVQRNEAEGSRGKAKVFTLWFKVAFPDITGCKKLEQYMTTIGEAKSAVTVSYTQQGKLIPDDVTATDQQRHAAMDTKAYEA